MPYGTVKVDTITFTQNGSDKSISVSGFAVNPTFSGDVTALGVFNGNIVLGNTVSGVNITGGAGGFNTLTGTTVTGTTANFVSGLFSTLVSGATVKGGIVIGTTTISGATVTGTNANFVQGNFSSLVDTPLVTAATLSGNVILGTDCQLVNISGSSASFTSNVTINNLNVSTTISSLTVTGTTSNFASGNFSASVLTPFVSGTTITGDTASFANNISAPSGVFLTVVSGTTVRGTTISGTTVTGTTGQFLTLTGNTVNAANFEGNNVKALLVSGANITGDAAGFTSITGSTIAGDVATFVSGIFSNSLSSETVTGSTGLFTFFDASVISGSVITGDTAGFTTITGTTVTGTTATFVTGTFSTLVSAPTVRGTTTVSGVTVTGTTGRFTRITGGTVGFTTVTGTTVTGTAANFVSGIFTTLISGVTVTGATGVFTTITGSTGIFTTTVSGATISGNNGYFRTIETASTGINAGNITLNKTNSATASENGQQLIFTNTGPTATRASGTVIGEVIFEASQASTPATLNEVVKFSCVADGTHTGTATPGKLSVLVNTSGTTTTEAAAYRQDLVTYAATLLAGLQGDIYEPVYTTSAYIRSLATAATTAYSSYATTTATRKHFIFYDNNGDNTPPIGIREVGYIQTNTNVLSLISISDYRVKENVVRIDDGIARVKQLKPSRFNFISKEEKKPRIDGFLAHEVQPVVPEAVAGVKDEVDENNKPVHQGLDQSKLIPLLTAALQECISRIETLEERVATLEAK